MNKRFVKAKYTNVEGKVFNGNIAIMYLYSDAFSHDFWVFRCPYCRNFFIARLDLVKCGRTKSCGCLRNISFREFVIRTQKGKEGDGVKHFDDLKRRYCSDLICEIEKSTAWSIYKVIFDRINQDIQAGLCDECAAESEVLDIIRLYMLNKYQDVA